MILDENILKILDLEEPSIQELRHISKKLNIKLRRSMKKKTIIKEIQKELRKLEQEGLIHTNKNKNILDFATNTYYDKDSLKNMYVNASLIYVYWSFSKETINVLKNKKEKNFFLRIFENDPLENLIRILETPVDIFKTKKLYINVKPNSTYYSEIGYKEKTTTFVSILTSNKINTPKNYPSHNKDELWLDLKTKNIKTIKSKEYDLIIEKINPIYSINNNAASSSFLWTGYDNI
ncbi:hypothetical protein OSSY52_02750 [Tepiditoga spiralis]|uniref:Rho termination factor N-terminal domain-containing protein n=1 Tax=Tepiditoga spiralis TaxID=2108365 RepID=A0A7G1G533_9BACT|nr:DUF4912 domain-containing protein [Tepiditoga spiralis]BBE30134.1 hypothetical protein OSSY52_02750 [Tepiditoga spiralis]